MNPVTPRQRFGAYHRISRLAGRDLSAETTISDKAAFEQMEAWATMRGVTIAERYLDVDQSGSKMTRPELDRMLADLDAGVIDGIVVAQVDRLSRADVGDALMVVKRIIGDERNPRSLALLDLGLDPASDTGELILGVLLQLARFQWKRYKRQWTTAQERAGRRGAWIGPAPLGYLRGEHGTLEFDPATWQAVSDAFEAAARDGVHAAALLLEREVPDKRWRTSDVRRVLTNRAYLGEHHAGGAGHDPITSPSVFAAAQTEPRFRRRDGKYPLSGIAMTNTGLPMVGALQTVNGNKYRRMRTGDGTCSISADRLEQYVRDQVAARLGAVRFRKLIEPVGKDEAEAALATAEAMLLAHVDKVPPTSAAYGPGVVKWEAAVNEARERLQLVAQTSARREELPAAGELDDPVKLLRAIRAGVTAITVRAGRGSVEDRVRVVFVGDDFDDGVRVLAS